MGFAPSGDLPDGIVIPEPVISNCTDADGNDCDYDYDYPNITPEEESRRQIVNRARNNANEQSGKRDRPNRNQNRGQQISQPITPAPLPRQNRPLGGQSTGPQAPPPARSNAFSSFQPAPPRQAAPPRQPAPPRQLAPSRQAAPARQAAPPRQPATQPAFQPAAFLPTPPSKPASGVRKNPGSSPLNPSRGRGSSGRGGSSNRARPAPQASRPSAPLPSRPQAAQAGRPSSSTGFSNFPARGGGGTSRQQAAPRAPPRQAAPAPRQQSTPRLQERPAPALPPPSFQNFGQQQQQANTPSNFQTRPAAPPARPALTFQDTPSSPLPPSALEVVDFNELLGVFQGQGGSSGQRFSSGSSRGFPAQAAVPQRNTQGLAVFQPQNFPARLY